MNYTARHTFSFTKKFIILVVFLIENVLSNPLINTGSVNQQPGYHNENEPEVDLSHIAHIVNTDNDPHAVHTDEEEAEYAELEQLEAEQKAAAQQTANQEQEAEYAELELLEAEQKTASQQAANQEAEYAELEQLEAEQKNAQAEAEYAELEKLEAQAPVTEAVIPTTAEEVAAFDKAAFLTKLLAVENGHVNVAASIQLLEEYVKAHNADQYLDADLNDVPRNEVTPEIYTAIKDPPLEGI